ncbi:MAG: hypothetical protein U0175_29760 [Caldilineaceae bacterium]
MSALDWLLEPDPINPGLRYFAFTDLLGYATDAPEVVAATRRTISTEVVAGGT